MDQIFSGTKAFQTPILARSLGQLATSFGGFFASCTAMYLCVALSLWIALPISLLTAGFLVRIFVIQHDCGHGSFFRSRWANELIGRLCSLMTLTPYAFWRRQHAAPRFLEQSRPARGKWAGYLLVVHDGRGIPGPWTLA
jgi:fatty acid desaturase